MAVLKESKASLRESLQDAIRDALSGGSLLIEPGDHPDRYPTLRVRYEGEGEWHAALRGRTGESYGGTASDVFIPVEIDSGLVDWSAATTIIPGGKTVIDEDIQQDIASRAQSVFIDANIDRWADTVLATLRERGVL